MARYVHCELCVKVDLVRVEKLYENKQDRVIDNER